MQRIELSGEKVFVEAGQHAMTIGFRSSPDHRLDFKGEDAREVLDLLEAMIAARQAARKADRA